MINYSHLLEQEIERSCQLALLEDLGSDQLEHGLDVSAELIDPETTAQAKIITREDCIFCGEAWINTVFQILGNQVSPDFKVRDGEKVTAGETICLLSGNARAMLTGERTAMNFVQTLSAVATETNRYYQRIKDSHCQLLDTRKTIPGMRLGQKYAVTCGGGANHRLGLWDAYLIKENHIMACGGIARALQQAKKSWPEKLLEIEVESLDELQQALDGGAQVVMLDNFDDQTSRKAVALRDNHPNQAKLEASGNVNLETIGRLAETGVDYISVGALTKNIQAIDLSMRIILDK